MAKYVVSFHLLIGHLHVCFGEMPVHIFCPYLNWVICLFIVELYVKNSRFGGLALPEKPNNSIPTNIMLVLGGGE